jgi:predicted PhzF superfamily epimerase YddE/YHI9
MRLFQIDSFTETAFCWPLVGDSNLYGSEPQYAIRYFTPTQEVPLCGHATLASGGRSQPIANTLLPGFAKRRFFAGQMRG